MKEPQNLYFSHIFNKEDFMIYFNNNKYSNRKNSTPSQASIMGDFDTLQKARKDLAGEIEAVMMYDEHIHNTTDRLAKMTWENIKSEELTHIGELMALLNYLDPSQQSFVEKGLNEFMERMNK